MRILALRVKQVGRFSEPVAIEGFADGVTVFTGDNETGKSTLFTALQTAFAMPYTSKDGKKVLPLQPYDTGAPHIEVDFSVGGQSWRLRKTFLVRPSAELMNLDTGAIVARNADVQPQLDTLRAGPSGLERFGLLWVAQGDALKQFELTPDSFSSLRQIVQQEVEGASVDEQSRRVHATVLARLAELVTPKTGKPTGIYAKAIVEADTADTRHRDAATRLAAAEERLTFLSKAASEVEQLRNPIARAARQTAITELDQALRKITEDRARARSAMELLRTAESELAAAKLAHQTWHGDLARAEDVSAASARIEVELAAARSAREQAAALEAQRTAETAAMAEKLATIETAIAAARAAEEHATRQRQRDELTERLSTLRSIKSDLEMATAAINESRIDDAALKKLRDLAATRDRLEQRLTAAAPEVIIEPIAGAERRIALDGKPLATSATVKVRNPLDIAIEGIGRITVRPGGGDTIAATEAERARVEHDLTALLSMLAVADLIEAERKSDARRDAERRRDEARAKLGALAPDGIEPIIAAHARLAAATASPPEARDPRPLAELHRLHDVLTTSQRAVGAALASARQAREEAARTEVRLETQLAETKRRVEELARALGPEAERPARTAERDQSLEKTNQKHADAARDASVWREVLQGEDRQAELERRLAEARAADASDTARLRQLELDMRGWETALAADNEADVVHEAEAAKHAAAAANDKLARLKEEVAALRKLEAMLSAELDAERSQIAVPVARRIAPYLDMVLPGASLAMNDGMAPSGLVRGTRTETLDRISRGTAEQIAVIARLGLGRLLADRGAPAPLILDDALVYADDRRIAALFAALTEAARHHQVIVLTCRERTFEALPGARVRLTPWRPSS